jgi:transcriptional regulator with XRE-family HTH domain
MSQTGDRLRELRTERHLSQERLARLADVAVRTVARIETGEGEGLESTLRALAKALEVPVSALVADEAEPAEPVAPA